MRGTFVRWIGLLPALVLVEASIAGGQDWRIQTQIFSGSQAEPVAENLTLFSGRRVYDFLLAPPQEITIFDFDAGLFVLLDAGRKFKTTISRDQVLEFTARLKARAASDERIRPLARFAADPKFDQDIDKSGRRVTLSSRIMTYRARGIAVKDTDTAGQHHRFSDWSARLNATRRGALPPFARLELNEVLAERKLIPTEVKLTISSSDRAGSDPVTLRSHHAITWRLTEADRKRIRAARAREVQFKPVKFETYRRLDAMPHRKTASRR